MVLMGDLLLKDGLIQTRPTPSNMGGLHSFLGALWLVLGPF
jgi:hypothetical protein